MSGTIHLIVEDKTDGDVVRAILKAKQINVKIRHLNPTKQGGISQLAKEIEQLIENAIALKKKRDCIVVLHDADLQTQDNRNDYEKIKSICNNKKYVVHIQAVDEIESWMLADEGLCKWLEIKPKNWDKQRKPSDNLKSLVNKKTKRGYSGANRAKVLEKLDGTGDKYSPSMRAAINHLENAPCIS